MKMKDDSDKTEMGQRSQNASEVPFEEAFELTGQGKFNRLVLLTSGLIMLNVSMESVGMSYVIPAAACQLQLTTEHKGLITASAFIGITCTSFLWGYLGDRYGRRAVMLPALVASAVVSVASAFSVNVWMLLILRIFTGCLVSASSATVYAYLGEMHTAAHRASAIAWGSAFISFSFMILPGLAWIVIPGTWSFCIAGFMLVPWRVFVLSWCIPGLMAAGLLMFLPESPKFVLALRGPAEALPVLAKMYSCNYGTPVHNFPIKKITATPPNESNASAFISALRNLALLFQPPLLRCVLISHASMFAVFMLSSGLYMWIPDILNNMLSNTDSQALSICDVVYQKYEATKNASLLSESVCNSDVSVALFPISIGMGAVFAITYMAIGFLINKVGKKTLYCGIMLACGVCTAAGGLVPNGVAATMLLVLALCSGCAASILAAITVDVFPTSLRAMSMCVMYMVGRAAAAVGANALGNSLDSHCRVAFCVFGVVTAGTTFLMLFWPKPEKIREEMEKKGLTY